jgi:hypothetical protein
LDSDAIPFEEEGFLDATGDKVGEKAAEVWMELVRAVEHGRSRGDPDPARSSI